MRGGLRKKGKSETVKIGNNCPKSAEARKTKGTLTYERLRTWAIKTPKGHAAWLASQRT